MAHNPPDYELDDRKVLTSDAEIRAISHPLRSSVLQLLHERAATVGELSVAVERPKSTVAHHVDVLLRAGLLRIVRTRRVRAIEERFYGRAARLFYVVPDVPGGAGTAGDFNDFEVAARDSAPAFAQGRLRGFVRRARLSEEDASRFWHRMTELVDEFDRMPRSGDTMYGFAVGIYPTEHPTLPPS